MHEDMPPRKPNIKVIDTIKFYYDLFIFSLVAISAITSEKFYLNRS